MVWVLGSMGWMPAAGQQTACVLVELKDELVMLDAGTGVANLDRCAEVLERHDRLTVVLSHYHLDHIAGLMYLKRFAAHKRVDVYGPGRPAYPCTTEDVLADVLQTSVYASGAKGFAKEVHYHDYAGHDFAVGNVRVGVRLQRHSSPSFELRLDDVLTYATDTCFDATTWQGYPATKILLHECWQLEADDPRHTSARALVTGMSAGTFERMALIHQNPSWSEADRAAIARLAGERFELAHDGMAFELG